MCGCILCLVLESSKESPTSTSGQLTVDETSTEGETDASTTTTKRFLYGCLAIACALAAPCFWTVKAYYIRLAEARYNFNVTQVTIDAGFLNALIQLTCLFIVLSTYVEFDRATLIQGSITAVLFQISSFCLAFAFQTGPGGPVNSLICTQTIYQTYFNYMFFGQSITKL